MVTYSEDYHATASAGDDADSWPTTSRGEFEIGIPAEFGGDFDGPAPENYYAVALTNCFVATFKVMADNSDVSFEELRADGTLRLRPDGKTTVVDSFELDVELQTATADRKTEVLLERTEGNCFILGSVGFPVTVNTELVTS
jgi:organic hydroperoxide reductase OsmC/OhrA